MVCVLQYIVKITLCCALSNRCVWTFVNFNFYKKHQGKTNISRYFYIP